MISSKSKLTPDDRNALAYLEHSLSTLTPVEGSSATPDVWIQGNISMFHAPFTTRLIPSSKTWRWNQTKAQKRAYLSRYAANVVFAKLIPRKRKAEFEQAPAFKLWQFTVSIPEYPDFIVLWCERGVQQTPASALDKVFDTAAEPPNKLYAAKISYICN